MPPGSQHCLSGQGDLEYMLTNPGPRGGTHAGSCFSHSASHVSFQNPAPPREDVESHPAWAVFLCHPRLTHPRPLAVPWKAGRTTFFWRDFCPCSPVPGGPLVTPGSCRVEGPRGLCTPFRSLQALPAEQLLSYRVFTKLGALPGPSHAHMTNKGALPT